MLTHFLFKVYILSTQLFTSDMCGLKLFLPFLLCCCLQVSEAIFSIWLYNIRLFNSRHVANVQTELRTEVSRTTVSHCWTDITKWKNTVWLKTVLKLPLQSTNKHLSLKYVVVCVECGDIQTPAHLQTSSSVQPPAVLIALHQLHALCFGETAHSDSWLSRHHLV